jgi:hypothetical protein
VCYSIAVQTDGSEVELPQLRFFYLLLVFGSQNFLRKQRLKVQDRVGFGSSGECLEQAAAAVAKLLF